MKRMLSLAVLMIFVFSLTSTALAFPKVLEKGATLTLNAKGLPEGNSSSFAQSEAKKVYAWFTYDNGNPGSTIQAAWNYCGTDNLCEEFLKTNKVKLLLSKDIAFFSLIVDEGKALPIGKYTVNIYYDDAPYIAVQFSIRED